MALDNRRAVIVKDGLWHRLRIISTNEDRSMSDLIREAINDLFAKRQGRNYDPVADRMVVK